MLLGSNLDKIVSHREAGTFGYIAPDVAQCGAWTVKSDVYSFGILLLDLMSKRVIDVKNTVATAVELWALKEYKPCMRIRVRAAPALARLVNLLHGQKSQYLIHNINPAHIVLDKCAALLGLAKRNGACAWTVKSDVYSFGVLLLDLMSKRVIDVKNTVATERCLDEKEKKRPLMKEVVNRLEALHVVQQHAERK
ncbi:uncharacterized protein LOC142162395 [Nicotiana tabacum]|uniref:Uncharacterized protein LOC142162395 n=1 Tax=Nicotiana tabacum TaxID=4097 RepID=A0AC58RQ56_TOBAC